MGQSLHRKVVAKFDWEIGCRIYAPVGSHEDLLAYLVRRLLENGANTSFVNRIVDDAMPIDALVKSPVDAVGAAEPKPHPGIRLPRGLFGPARRNSLGLDLNDADTLQRLAREMETAEAGAPWRAAPGVLGSASGARTRAIANPANRRQVIGEVVEADESHVEAALEAARRAAPGWSSTAGRQPRRLSGAHCRSARSEHVAWHGDRGTRSRKDPCRRDCGSPRSSGFLPLLCAKGARRLLRTGRSPGSDGRDQPHRTSRPRRIRLYLAVELSPGDLLRSGQCGTGRRQRRHRQTGGADTADGGVCCRSDAPCRDSARTHCNFCP